MSSAVIGVAGPLANRIGERPLMAIVLALQAIGAAWLALIGPVCEQR